MENNKQRFGVKDDVYILDTEIYDSPKWIRGVVEEVGDDTILVKWDDLTDPTEYQLSDLPDIRFKIPDNRNREIRFRVWTGSKMEYNIMAGFLGSFYVQGMDEKDAACMSSFNTIYEKETPLMQFIGQKDRNRTDIYESDIVEVEYRGKIFKGQVKWNQQSASYIFINEERYLEIISMAAYGDGEMLVLDKVDIIGNIYETPELLTTPHQ